MITRIANDGPWRTATVEIAIERQSETLEALCYRTLRELILNARKHSNADTLTITGAELAGALTFTVQDDGAGFDPCRLDPADHHLNLGLDTVIERVRLAGGHVQITSSPGAGARIELTLPSEPRQASGPA